MGYKACEIEMVRIALRDIEKLERFHATLSEHEKAWMVERLPDALQTLSESRVGRIKKEYQLLRAKTAFCVKQQGYTYSQIGIACDLALQRIGQFVAAWKQYRYHWQRAEFIPQYPLLTWYRTTSAERTSSTTPLSM